MPQKQPFDFKMDVLSSTLIPTTVNTWAVTVL